MSGAIRMCAAAGCYRTFSACGSQRYCQNRDCQSARFVAGLSPLLQSVCAKARNSPERREAELRDLIGEQSLDLRRGHRIQRDDKRTRAVLSLDAIPEWRMSEIPACEGVA